MAMRPSIAGDVTPLRQVLFQRADDQIASYDLTTAAVRGSSASALVIGTISKNRSTSRDACVFTSMRATNLPSAPAWLLSVRGSVAVMG